NGNFGVQSLGGLGVIKNWHTGKQTIIGLQGHGKGIVNPLNGNNQHFITNQNPKLSPQEKFQMTMQILAAVKDMFAGMGAGGGQGAGQGQGGGSGAGGSGGEGATSIQSEDEDGNIVDENLYDGDTISLPPKINNVEEAKNLYNYYMQQGDNDWTKAEQFAADDEQSLNYLKYLTEKEEKQQVGSFQDSSVTIHTY
ncbi:MAG: hypothetical protein ACTSRA_21770, partial [Promethearchaeota archaeon]